MSESIKIDNLIEKLIAGSSEMSREDLQLYVNNTEEIERRLSEIKHDAGR